MTATDTSTSAIPRAAGALPLLGHAIPLLRDPLSFLRSLPQHGELVAVRIGPHPAIVVCDTQLLHHVLVNDRIFDKGGPFYDRAREFIGNDLATCPHAQHRQQRRPLQPAFRPDLLPGNPQTMAVQFDEATSTWREGQIIDVLHETRHIASRALIATLFGAGPDPIGRERIATDTTTLVTSAYRRTIQPDWLNALPTPANTRCRRAVRRLRSTIAAYIAEQRTCGDAGLMLSMLLEARDSEVNGQGLSDVECIEQVTAFFLAGTESTAVTLTWALHLLATHPDLQHEVRAEADRAENTARSDPEQLPLTRAVVTEALRLYPLAWLSMRVTTTDTTLASHPIPVGTTVVFSPYLIHHRPDLYPDPDRFDPGRWTGAAHPPTAPRVRSLRRRRPQVHRRPVRAHRSRPRAGHHRRTLAPRTPRRSRLPDSQATGHVPAEGPAAVASPAAWTGPRTQAPRGKGGDGG